MTELRCLAYVMGVDFFDWQVLFYSVLYVPLLFLIMLGIAWQKFEDSNYLSNKIALFALYTGIIWYSPAVQVSASMFRCYEDPYEGSCVKYGDKVFLQSNSVNNRWCKL